MIVIVILIAALLLVLLVLASIKPGRRRDELLKPFEEVLIAHRGLFDNDSDAPENSMAAFRRAVDAGYGIELDVQMSSDGRLFVFHDDDMERMTGKKICVTKQTYEELCRYPLGKSRERVPLFQDVLELVDGKVPMVIEIKVGFDYKATTMAVAKMLESYHGIYCMECFNPLALGWYRRNVPGIARGQLSMDYKLHPAKLPGILRFLLTHLMLNFISRPDFVSYHHSDSYKLGFRIFRNLFHGKTAAWTIRSQEELEKNRKLFSIFIFDRFIPHSEQAYPR